jgi:DNA-binding NtrC family response regulator
VISDIRLPDANGDRLFEELRARGHVLPPFIFMTGYADLHRAVDLLKLGAADYLTKPFDLDRLLERVAELLPSPSSATGAEPAPLGISEPMRHIEEMVARRLHALGRGGPFFAVNCAAIPEGLIESELFGHEKGAFTGAGRSHKGVFERARGGTLLLDEIGDMPPPMQARLLRVLQERTITPVGAERCVPVDVHLVCATHQDLDARVAEGRFRQDLLYRINLVHLEIPPLRDRGEDILWLARRFLDQWCANQGRPRKHLDPEAEQALLAHDWPGNVRDLRHTLERACIFSDGNILSLDTLFPAQPGRPIPGAGPCRQTLNAYLRDCERRFIEHCLRTHEGRILETASDLGISRKALWDKMKRLGVESP